MNEYSLYNPAIDNNQDSLAHHGILGMKWGVRRYQNPDGSLTALGRKRLGLVGSSRLLTALENADAVGVYKRERRRAKSQARIARSRAQSAAKKADKMQASDDSAKASELKQKSIREENEAKAWDEVVKSYDQKIKDIKSGDVRAGRDFLIQYDADFTLPVAAFLTGAATGFPLPLLTPIDATIINVPKEKKRADEATSTTKENDVVKQSLSSNNSDKTPSEEKSSAAEPSRKTYKSDMMETARKTGKYDIDFLESIQNSYVLEGSKKERLREYSKYLDNPRTYEAPPETRPSPKSKTPKDKLASRAKAMQGQYTQAEIAEKLGISPSYVSSLLS